MRIIGSTGSDRTDNPDLDRAPAVFGVRVGSEPRELQQSGVPPLPRVFADIGTELALLRVPHGKTFGEAKAPPCHRGTERDHLILVIGRLGAPLAGSNLTY